MIADEDGEQELIGKVDAILVSNSTWISEDRPCITYGLRGVIHCSIEVCLYMATSLIWGSLFCQIASERPDLHSGVDGGGVSEPMFDM